MKIKNHETKKDSQIPFFWFGDAWFADKLSGDFPIYCFPSGRIQIKETEYFIQAMAQYCLNELLEVHPEGPFILGGFCFDAWIAYEVLQLLKCKGFNQGTLVMIECYTLDKIEERFNAYAFHLKQLIRGPVNQRFRYIKSLIKSEPNNRDQLTTSLDFLSVDDQVNLLTKIALEHYIRLPSNHNVELIFGQDSWHSPFYRYGRSLSAGWFQTISEELPLFFTPGTHETILEEPYVNDLANLVQERMRLAAHRFQIDCH